MLNRIRIRTKLAIILLVSTLALLASGAIAVVEIRNQMLADRLERVHAIVETAHGIARWLESEVQAGRLKPATAASFCSCRSTTRISPT